MRRSASVPVAITARSCSLFIVGRDNRCPGSWPGSSIVNANTSVQPWKCSPRPGLEGFVYRVPGPWSQVDRSQRPLEPSDPRSRARLGAACAGNHAPNLARSQAPNLAQAASASSCGTPTHKAPLAAHPPGHEARGQGRRMLACGLATNRAPAPDGAKAVTHGEEAEPAKPSRSASW